MMRMSFISRMRCVVAVVAAILVAACGGEKAPADLIPADRMVEFLTDAYLLEGFYAVESEYRYDALTPDVVRAYDDIGSRWSVASNTIVLTLIFTSLFMIVCWCVWMHGAKEQGKRMMRCYISNYEKVTRIDIMGYRKREVNVCVDLSFVRGVRRVCV